MPELPDIELYVHALNIRIKNRQLLKVRTLNPFVLRTVDPPLTTAENKKVLSIYRIGKRVVFRLETDLFLVFHLMVSGRFRWQENANDSKSKLGGKIGHAVFEFENGKLVLTEASSHKRASMHLVKGGPAVRQHDPGGIEPLACSFDEFQEVLLAENRTLKRSLTNPKSFSGIGNAYSDEILHAARLSPLRLTSSLNEDEAYRLYHATVETLTFWIEKLRIEFGDGFPGPGDVTAFRPDFAAHGKFGQPCPVCGAPIQRIRYAENETNYCANCQNEGRLLADRALSRLLKNDWPKTLEEMEGG